MTAVVQAALLTAGVALLVPAEDARRIVDQAQRRAQATSQHYEGLLRVVDAKGKSTAEKKWTYDRQGSNGNSKVVIRFTAPAEVKGVALLVVNHPERSSDQWMWTPALNRERRIALQDRRTRFFGTDFSFEDLEERDVDHDAYTLVGEDNLDGDACWKIEGRPREGRKSQYVRSTLWIRKDNYSYSQLENFDDTRLVRRLKYGSMENIQGIWTAKVLEMEDFTRHSKTVLTMQSVKYNVSTSDDHFTLEALRRD